MKHQARDLETNDVIHECCTHADLVEEMEMMYPDVTDWYYTKEYECRNCGKTAEMRHDVYNIPTGPYCDSCYETNYPYRKDAYDPYNEFGTR